MTMNSPQDILDQLRLLDLPRLYAGNLTAKDRLALVKLANQKLQQAKRSLREEMKYIEARWDERNKDEAKREFNELLPYALVDEVSRKIETDIQAIETMTQTNRPLPVPKAYGFVIAGGAEYGGYVLSDRKGVIGWQLEHIEDVARGAKAAELTKESELRQQIDEARKHRFSAILILTALAVLLEVIYPLVARLEAIYWVEMGGLAILTLLIGFGLWVSGRRRKKHTIANLESEREKGRVLTSEHLQKLKAEYDHLRAEFTALQGNATPSSELVWKALEQEV